MTQLVYDHQIFSRQRVGGVSRYFVELAAGVAANSEFATSVVAPLHMNVLLAARRDVPLVGTYLPHIRGTGALRFAVNARVSHHHLRRMRPDIVHETYFSDMSGTPCSPMVITVFDMIHELFPQFFRPDDSTARRKRAAVQRASHVICISESTRQDLLTCIDVDPERVSVIPLAANDSFGTASLDPRSVPMPYVLYVGEREGYKNFKMALTAFLKSGLPSKGVAFVCFGGGAWSASDAQRASELGMPPSLLIHRHGNDRALAELYQNAEAFLYPSLYEGFGIPPLEAMNCGCPVICSRTSSLPEVVADAAELFDPADVDDIARALRAVVGDSDRSRDLRYLGARRASEFSWLQCALRTTEIYRRML